MSTMSKRYFYITRSGPRATHKEIQAAMRARYDRLETAFSDMGGGLIFDSTGAIVAFHERFEEAVIRYGAHMEFWDLEIARDFDYHDPRGLVLDVIRNGVKERWIYRTTVPEALAEHANLRNAGATYIDTHLGGEHWRWSDAEVKWRTECEATA